MMFPTWTVNTSSFWAKSMAPVGHSFSQARQVPLRKYVQFSTSITGYLGTACGNGVYTALR